MHAAFTRPCYADRGVCRRARKACRLAETACTWVGMARWLRFALSPHFPLASAAARPHLVHHLDDDDAQNPSGQGRGNGRGSRARQTVVHCTVHWLKVSESVAVLRAMEGRGSLPLADVMGELGVLHGKEGGSCVL
jgi:hypothetical protein